MLHRLRICCNGDILNCKQRQWDAANEQMDMFGEFNYCALMTNTSISINQTLGQQRKFWINPTIYLDGYAMIYVIVYI